MILTKVTRSTKYLGSGLITQTALFNWRNSNTVGFIYQEIVTCETFNVGSFVEGNSVVGCNQKIYHSNQSFNTLISKLCHYLP